MLTEEIRRKVVEAMKAGDPIAKGILRVALGEVQSAEATRGKPLDDGEVATVLRKLVKANEEVLAAGPKPERRAVLEGELRVLAGLLPRTLGEEEILAALAPVREALLAAKGDGQATGIAMKALKASGASVTGEAVAAAVKRMRG